MASSAKTVMLDVAIELSYNFPNKDTIIKHTSQFSVITRFATDDTLCKESLSVLPIKELQELRIHSSLLWSSLRNKNLPMDTLISICAGGAPCVVEKTKSFWRNYNIT